MLLDMLEGIRDRTKVELSPSIFSIVTKIIGTLGVYFTSKFYKSSSIRGWLNLLFSSSSWSHILSTARHHSKPRQLYYRRHSLCGLELQ